MPATDKGEAADTAADTAAADLATDLEPGHVESGEVDPNRPTNSDIEATIIGLATLDAKARAAGHSLGEILAIAAKNALGIDLR
jgi:hypothetical protein